MVEYICDGCGKREKAKGDYDKPEESYARADEDGEQHACSREFVETVSKKTGKTNVVLPI